MSDPTPTLDYNDPRTDTRARLKRYGLFALVGGLGTGFALAFAWIWFLKTAVIRHPAWVSHLWESAPELVAMGLICAPLLVAAFLFDRTRKRLVGAQLAAEKAEERRLQDEEKTGIGWKVPKSAEAAGWPVVLIVSVVLYVVSFIALLVIGTVAVTIDRLIPPRQHLDDGTSPFRLAFICANVIGVAIPAMFVLMLLAFPRVRVTLISDGVFERGISKNLIPYSSIQKVCIAPSQRRANLKCFAILAADELRQLRWHRFDFGPEAPVSQIIKAFESKRLSVEVVERLAE